MKKVFSKTKAECKVTFTIPEEVLGGSKKASIAGDFNGWNIEELPVKITKGVGSASVTLASGNSYQYKIVIDGERWENDPEADGYVTNEFGEANSVVSCIQ